MKTDVLIVGSGCSGLYCALNLPRDIKITIITKSDLESNDSYLAQGGMCMLKEAADYESFFEDTLKAGHYENDRKSVEIMIKSSPEVVKDLVSFGADFEREDDGSLAYTREGAHSNNRIIFHEDVTGKEITSTLLRQVKKLPNVTLLEYTTMVDIIEEDNVCYGAVIRTADGNIDMITAAYTVMASGGVGGLYKHSTNFRHLTGDALAIAAKHNVVLKNPDYVQIHPTTFYSEKPEDRSFLISESVRGEGAKLYDKNMNRFVDELLPRDVLTGKIRQQMEKDNTEFVWEDLRTIPKEELIHHFPNIIEHCRKMGYDVFKECIPVVPAQHYFMGGIKVNHHSRTSMDNLYAVGEAACNGVHGKNRLASNSLLESLVFARRAAGQMKENGFSYDENKAEKLAAAVDIKRYLDADKLDEEYRKIAIAAINKGKNEQRKEFLYVRPGNVGIKC